MDEDLCQEIPAVVGNENGQNVEDLIVSISNMQCSLHFL